jgi:ABC-2 type transport system permease protein
MRKFFALLGRELKSYFYSPIAWVVMFFFLLLNGFNFYSGIRVLNVGASHVTIVEVFFDSVPFWFGFVLTVPLITMRSFSEEWKMGTIEPLMTAPVRDWQVVLSKFVSALVFFAVLWLPSVSFFRLFEVITQIPAAEAPGALVGSYLLLFLMGMFFISVGCLASALTRNQIIAAVMSFSAITLMFMFALLSVYVLNVSPMLSEFIGYFSAIDHMATFSKGLIDSRPIIFYLSMTALMLYLTLQVFQARKWKV